MNVPGSHCKNRVFEWAMAFSLVGLGVHLIIWPDAIAVSKFQFMLDVIGSRSLMVFYLVLGLLRTVALFLNGNWVFWGPRVRVCTAIGSAMVWFQMDASLYIAQRSINADPSPSLWLYTALVGGEIYSAYRAAADARPR